MKKIYIILLLVLSAFAFKANAQVVLGPLRPNGTLDTYPTHIDSLGKGGFRSVASIAERDGITAERRREGMLVYVGEDKSFYNLIGTTLNPIDPKTINKTINNNWWVKVTLGGGGSSTGGGIISGIGNPNDPTTTTPANPQPGDYYLDTSTNILYGPYSTTTGWSQVGTGPVGAGQKGDKGDTGAQILSGSGAPSTTIVPPNPLNPQPGDYYFDTVGKTLYGPFSSTTGWPSGTALNVGAQGIPGSQILSGSGAPDATTPLNPRHGDYYFDTTQKDLYGPYNSNIPAWPTPGTSLTGGAPGVGVSFKGSYLDLAEYLKTNTAVLNQAYYNTTDGKSYIYTGTGAYDAANWKIFAQDGTGGGGGADGVDWALFANKDMTATPFNKFNPGPVANLQEFIQNVFYPSQAPLAKITLPAGTVIERPSGTSANVVVNWEAATQGNSKPVASVVITAGNPAATPQSAAGAAGATSGNTTFSVPVPGGSGFTNTVTTTDGKSATATIGVSFLSRRYWGRTSSAKPTEADIELALGGNSELSGSQAKGDFTIDSDGSNLNHIFFAYPANLPDLISLTINDFDIITDFTQTTVSVTNVPGYNQDYKVYTSNKKYSAKTPAIKTN